MGAAEQGQEGESQHGSRGVPHTEFLTALRTQHHPQVPGLQNLVGVTLAFLLWNGSRMSMGVR